MIATLQGSFQVFAAATIRVERTDSFDTVDWVVAAGDAWNSADEMLAEWTAEIQSDTNFGSAFEFAAARDATNHYCIVTYTGPASIVVTWSATGDGTAIRDWLGASGTTTSLANEDVFPAAIDSSYVASYGAVRAHRVETGRTRGHHLALDGTSMVQHHGEDDDAVTLDVELWSGDEGATNSRAALSRFEAFVDALFDSAGGAEPFSLFTTNGDGSRSEQWVLWFSTAPLRIVPQRVDGARADRLWRIRFPAVAEVVPW